MPKVQLMESLPLGGVTLVEHRSGWAEVAHVIDEKVETALADTLECCSERFHRRILGYVSFHNSACSAERNNVLSELFNRCGIDVDYDKVVPIIRKTKAGGSSYPERSSRHNCYIRALSVGCDHLSTLSVIGGAAGDGRRQR